MPAATAHTCQSQAGCLSALMSIFFRNVKGDDGCLMWTTTVHLCVTVPLMTLWGSVLRAPASCPHPGSMSVWKPETCFGVVRVKPESEHAYASLLVMQVSFFLVNEYVGFCRDKEKSLAFYVSLRKKYRREWWSSHVSLTCVVFPSVAASLQKKEKYRISAG